MKKLLVVLMALGMSLGVWGSMADAGASPVRERRASREVPPGGSGNVSASCPRGLVPTGGGYSHTPGLLRVLASTPVDAGWNVAYDNASADPALLVVTVLCTNQ